MTEWQIATLDLWKPWLLVPTNLLLIVRGRGQDRSAYLDHGHVRVFLYLYPSCLPTDTELIWILQSVQLGCGPHKRTAKVAHSADVVTYLLCQAGC